MNDNERTIEVLKEIQDALPAKFANVTKICGTPAIYRLLYLIVLHAHAVPEYYPAVKIIKECGSVIYHEDDTITFGGSPILIDGTGYSLIAFKSWNKLAEGWSARFLVDANGRTISMEYSE